MVRLRERRDDVLLVRMVFACAGQAPCTETRPPGHAAVAEASRRSRALASEEIYTRAPR